MSTTRKLRPGYRQAGGATWVNQGWRTARIDPETGDLESMWVYSDLLSDHRTGLAEDERAWDGTVLAVEKVNASRTGWERTGTLVKKAGKVTYHREPKP